LGPQLALLLGEIPASRRPSELVPLLRNEPWAAGELQAWADDSATPALVKRAISATKGKA
jgi:hypothetical protein